MGAGGGGGVGEGAEGSPVAAAGEEDSGCRYHDVEVGAVDPRRARGSGSTTQHCDLHPHLRHHHHHGHSGCDLEWIEIFGSKCISEILHFLKPKTEGTIFLI